MERKINLQLISVQSAERNWVDGDLMKCQWYSSPSGLFIYYINILVCIFCWSGVTKAQETGSIDLVVLNKTTGLPIAGHELTLLRHNSEEEQEETLLKVVTDSNGQYKFAGLPADESHYVIVTRYLEIPYLTEHITLGPGEQQTIVLEVYDITTNENELIHSAIHLVIETTPDILNIMEIIVLDNKSNMTFAPPPNSGLGLIYSLPSAAFGLQPMVQGLRHTDRGLLFSAPVKPGPERIIYTYSLDRTSVDHKFVRQMDYNISRVQLLVSPSTEIVTAVNLTNDGEQRIGDKDYLLLSNRVGLQKGMSVEVAFPYILTWQVALKWGMLGFVILILIGGIFVGIRIKPEKLKNFDNTTGVEPKNKRKYTAILHAIANLDDQKDAGILDARTYRSRRDGLQKRALRLHQNGSKSE